MKDNEEQLAKAVADVNARMTAEEAESERIFRQEREAFSQKLRERVALELAKAEAQREQKKQLAIAVAMTYFTGGAAVPALAAAGTSGAGGKAANTAQRSSAAVANPTKVGADNVAQKQVPGAAAKPAGVKVYDSPAGPPFLSSPTEPPLFGTLKTAWTCGSAVLGFAGCLDMPSPWTCGPFIGNAFGCLDRLLQEQQGPGR